MGWLRGVYFSSMIFEIINIILDLFIFFFLRKHFECQKAQNKKKPANKSKISKH